MRHCSMSRRSSCKSANAFLLPYHGSTCIALPHADGHACWCFRNEIHPLNVFVCFSARDVGLLRPRDCGLHRQIPMPSGLASRTA